MNVTLNLTIFTPPPPFAAETEEELHYYSGKCGSLDSQTPISDYREFTLRIKSNISLYVQPLILQRRRQAGPASVPVQSSFRVPDREFRRRQTDCNASADAR